MLRRFYRRSVRERLMAVVLISTVAALLVTGLAMLVYELRTYQQTWVSDLTSQADLLARATGAALDFDDRKAAQENLATLRIRPKISAAAIYKENGSMFVRYQRDAKVRGVPVEPPEIGHWVENGDLALAAPIVVNGDRLGTIYLRAEYEVFTRLADYLGILAAVLLTSIAVAFLLATRLQQSITEPILDVTAVARRVMKERNFSLRARKTTEDEVGYLVDAFNDMLAEIGQRAKALEQANRALQREMTERLEAEEALRTADRRKDEFLATLAHELRNPLAPLRNGLQIMRMTDDKPAMLAQAREVMERQLQHMVRLVDDLLDVSRITTGKLVLRKERTTLNNVVRNALETVRPFIESRRHPVAVTAPEQDVVLYADEARLAQVFANLLNNAAKYSDPGSPIEFIAGMDGDTLKVDVVDHGIGIAPQAVPVMFEMFAQADHSLERSHAGLGVGLALAKRLIELHGGHIEVESLGAGQGSRFTVLLPVRSRLADEAAQEHHQAQSAAPRAYRILLADDNVDFANSMATLLRVRGHEVRVAHDGQAGLELAQDFVPDVAFLDIGMPKMNGYELARRLRASAETARMKLVAVTGWGQMKDKEDAMAAGFDFHLVKPVEFDRIESILSGLRGGGWRTTG